MVSGNVNQQALDDALSAVKQTKQENAACLHTLAAVYAELGKTPEALENLRRAVEIRGERIEEADWYVLGRIAEQYGLDEVAAGLYRKVPAKPAAAADDVYAAGAATVEEGGEIAPPRLFDRGRTGRGHGMIVFDGVAGNADGPDHFAGGVDNRQAAGKGD